MELHSAIILEFVKKLIPIFLKKIEDLNVESREIELKLEEHISFVESWSQEIQFYGMARHKDTALNTIKLNIGIIPRKFRGPLKEANIIDEITIISDNNNYILLGDPGSGKTTTLKRVARRTLFEEPMEGELWQYPIVVRLKELEHESSLIELLADRIGILFEKKEEEIRERVFIDDGFFTRRKLKHNQVIKREKNGQTYLITKFVRYFVGKERLDKVLSTLLSNTKAILLLDGLDEVPSNKKESIIEEIELLNNYTMNLKTIISCRSGDYSQSIKGFDILEICPLDNSQKFEISRKWLSDPEAFMEKLMNLPYSDLADRPLFLTHLIVIYENQGYLPDQPSFVYKKIIHLMLELWDSQRRIKRQSEYSLLTPERKLEFLSAVSYQITYKSKLKVFKESDLINIYNDIYDNFRLSKNECQHVVQEIESHTGLLVESGGEYFEFSHLSLQEYLCAYYLVRAPFSRYLEDYLREYPAPVAIAVAISSDPSEWFAKLILTTKNFPYFTPDSTVSFLFRLVTEKPYFNSSISLGLALLRICFVFPNKTREPIIELLKDSHVEKSFIDALGYYRHLKNKDEGDRWYFAQNFELSNLGHGYAHVSGYLDKELVINYMKSL